MNRLPKKRGITQDGEDKSLILRQNLDDFQSSGMGFECEQ
jgi:hypothetical protein